MSARPFASVEWPVSRAVLCCALGHAAADTAAARLAIHRRALSRAPEFLACSSTQGILICSIPIVRCNAFLKFSGHY